MPTKIFRAFHLTEGLKLTSLLGLFPERPFRASGTELVYRFERDQYLIIYNFGSLVLYDIDPSREERILSTLRAFVSPKDDIVTSEEFFLEKGEHPSVDFRKVVLDRISFGKIEMISLVLAQSTAIDYFERIVNNLLTKSGEISEKLEKEGRIDRKDRDLVKFIGFCLNMKQKVISSTYVLDSPDPTWEDPSLERLHRQMAEMFELRERYRTLEYKLKLVQETLEILADLARTRRMLYLEASIVLLIIVEIALSLLGMGK